MAKLEVPAAAEAPPLEDVVALLYDVSKDEVALTAGAQEGNFLAFAAVKPEVVVTDNGKSRPLGRFVKVFMGDGDMERVRRAVAVELERLPSELYAVEEPHRKIVEEVAAYVAERGRLEGERYKELYRRFRELYHLPAQLIQQAINQGVEIGKSFLTLKRNGCIHKPQPEVRRIAIRFAKDSWSYKKAISTAAPVKIAVSLPGGRREAWIKPHRF